MSWIPPDKPDAWTPPDQPDKESGIKKFLSSANQKAGVVAQKGFEALNVPFELAGEAVRIPRENKPLSDFQPPTIMGGHPSDIASEIARGYSGIASLMAGEGIQKAGEMVQEKPSSLTTAAYGAMLPVPQVGATGKMTKILKTEKALGPEISTSKMIAGKLQDSSLRNLANPYVNKVAHSPNLSMKTDSLVDEAADSFKNAYNSIKEIQNKFYKNAGITDDLPIDVGNALKNMSSKLAEYSKTAIGTADESAIKEAGKILSDITSKTKNGTLTFDQLKKMKSSLFALGESNTSELGRNTPISRLFKDMGHELTESQKQLPQIIKAGDKYKDLLEAEDLMEHATRLDKYSGEINLAKKIKNRYLDIGNQDWKDMITKAEEIFKKYPESEKFADFGDKIKAAHLALDVAKSKAILPIGSSRFFGVQSLKNITKVLDPQFQVNMLARGIKNGAIDIGGLLGKVKETQWPVGGSAITRMRALKSIVNTEKPTNAVRKAGIPTAMAIRAYLQGAKQ